MIVGGCIIAQKIALRIVEGDATKQYTIDWESRIVNVGELSVYHYVKSYSYSWNATIYT